MKRKWPRASAPARTTTVRLDSNNQRRFMAMPFLPRVGDKLCTCNRCNTDVRGSEGFRGVVHCSFPSPDERIRKRAATVMRRMTLLVLGLLLAASLPDTVAQEPAKP